MDIVANSYFNYIPIPTGIIVVVTPLSFSTFLKPFDIGKENDIPYLTTKHFEEYH